MSAVRLILREILHRKVNGSLSALSVLAAVALFVGFFTTEEAARRETTRNVRDMGFNLRIIPKDTDMDFFWASGRPDRTFPEEAFGRLCRYEKIFSSYNHLVAVLEEKIELGGKETIFTGLSPAVTAPAQRKQPMGYQIKAGTVLVGHQVARRLGLKAGEPLEISGVRFTVARCLLESGTDDDIRIFGLLSDVQRALRREGQISEIKAIDCLCLTSEQDPLAILRRELEAALPEAKVVQLRAIADARARERQMAEKYFAFLLPFVLVACAASVSLLAALNVRDRALEIGILRALGYGSRAIAFLFLGKAVLIGLAGAVPGAALGSALALAFGPGIFPITASAIRVEPAVLAWAVGAAPLFAAFSSWIPALVAVTRDPAAILRGE